MSNSYEDALAKNGVDKSAAFDGAWAKATPGDVADGSWGAFLGMDTDRITTSHTSNGLNEWQAKALVMFDFLRTAQDMGPSGFGAAVGELISRGGTAMVDYFKDTLGAAFDFLISPANGSDPGLSDQIDDLLSRLTPDKNGLNALLSGLEKIFDNQDIEDAKDHLDHAKSVSSPIVLDLDGNGVSTTAVKDGAYFDHAGDGFAERTGWVGTGDGLLVRDLDGNGRIDTGAELFGSETRLADGTKAANGFEALKSLDGNHDGQIDANDPAFASLKIWIDADGDGYSQPGELLTLTQAGVAAIATGYAVSTLVDAQGTAHSQIGTYTRADGGVAAAEDVWFAVDRAYSLATTWADVPTDIAALPDLPGYGTVRDLHQAMALDTGGNLETLVAAYVAEPDEGQRHSLLDAIVYAWTGVDGIDPHSRGGYTDRATPMLGYPAGVH